MQFYIFYGELALYLAIAFMAGFAACFILAITGHITINLNCEGSKDHERAGKEQTGNGV